MTAEQKSRKVVKKRPNIRREATRKAIIETAEKLFGEHGVDAVSLRQIGVAIGAGNTSVVLYHFGDQEALVEAILQYRLPDFELRRQELLASLGERDAALADLLRVLWQPLFEQRDADGRHSYAAFLASLGRSRWGWVWSDRRREFPVTVSLGKMIANRMTESARPLFMERSIACTPMVTTMLGLADRIPDCPMEEQQRLFDDAIRMAAAAFAAPGPARGKAENNEEHKR